MNTELYNLISSHFVIDMFDQKLIERNYDLTIKEGIQCTNKHLFAEYIVLKITLEYFYGKKKFFQFAERQEFESTIFRMNQIKEELALTREISQ